MEYFEISLEQKDKIEIFSKSEIDLGLRNRKNACHEIQSYQII
jgi:hypothetical protein